MGKKSRTSRTSNGERRSVAKTTCKAMKSVRTEAEKVMNCLAAYQNGKKVKRYGFDKLGEPRFNHYKMKQGG